VFFILKMSDEKNQKKRSPYDEELYALFQVEKHRKAEEQKEYEQRLRKPVPLPNEAAMEAIIKDIHKIIAETGEPESLEFDVFNVDRVDGIRFHPYIHDEWLVPVKEWLEELRNTPFENPTERQILADHAMDGVKRFFDYICNGYNAKHTVSRAERREGGFEVFY
jgi:hypothetical protein